MIPFGWSAGDLLGAIGVITKVINALNESRGAKPDYQNLMKDLYNLVMILYTLHGLETDRYTSEQSNALLQSVRECEECIERFLQSHEKYRPLTAGTSNLTDQILKIKWMSLHQDEVRKFRGTLSFRTASLNLVLSRLNLSQTLLSEEKAESHANEAELLLGQVLRNQNDASASSTENQRLLGRIESMLKNLHVTELSSPAEVSSPFLVRPFKLEGAPLAPVFVQRPGIMDIMENKLLPISEERQTILVLQGMGGIGKSQMAREYACRHREEYTAIFWVNAKTENTIRIGIAGIANRLWPRDELGRIDREKKPGADLNASIAAVMNWFGKDNNTKWLLIVDNVDSQVQPEKSAIEDRETPPDALFDVSNYLPSSSHGTIVATSRLSYLARSVGGVSCSVQEMSSSEGLEVICALSGRLPDEAGGKTLVDKLGCYPLALSQAGRYIHETQDSFLVYLERYERRLESLLKQKPSTREYQNGSVSATLSLSYEALKHQNPSAAALLAFCGCIDNTNILWSLFSHSYKISQADGFPPTSTPNCPWIPGLAADWLVGIQRDEEEYDKAIYSLMAFSFVRREVGSPSISIHPVIHHWSVSLHHDEVRDHFCEVVAELVSRKFLDPNILSDYGLERLKDERLIGSYLPHADRCLSLVGQKPEWHPRSVISLARYFGHYSRLGIALNLAEHGLKLLQESGKSTTNAELLNCIQLRLMVDQVHDLSFWIGEDRITNLRSAHVMLQEVEFRDEDQRTYYDQCILMNLCEIFRAQKRYAEALKAHDVAFERWEKTGMSVEIKYWCLGVKAQILIDAGQDSEAIFLGREILAWTKTLSKSNDLHYVRAQVRYWLGRAYCNAGDCKRGQKHLLFALIGQLTISGLDLFALSYADYYYRSLLLQDIKYQSLSESAATCRWNFAISRIVEKHSSTLRYISQNLRRDLGSSIYHDRWSYVLQVVRLLVRHRKGTTLYNRAFQQLQSDLENEQLEDTDPQIHTENLSVVPSTLTTRERRRGLRRRLRNVFSTHHR